MSAGAITGKNVEENLFVWNRDSGELEKDKNGRYSFVWLQGIKCQRILMSNGQERIFGENKERGISIIKEPDSQKIYRTDIFTNIPSLTGKTKARYIIEPHGQSTLIEKCSYDENGKIIKHLFDGQWVTYSANKEEAKDASSGELRFLKKMDESGRVVEFFTGSQTYGFKYLGKDTEVTILNKDRSLSEKIIVPTTNIQKIFFP
jgi:hypothetical protein